MRRHFALDWVCVLIRLAIICKDREGSGFTLGLSI